MARAPTLASGIAAWAGARVLVLLALGNLLVAGGQARAAEVAVCAGVQVLALLAGVAVLAGEALAVVHGRWLEVVAA